MKRLLILFVPILIGLASCNGQLKEGTGEAIEPIGVQDLSEDNSGKVLEAPGIELLVQQIMIDNGVGSGKDYAMVVNQKQQLKGVKWGDDIYQWPEIDLDRYSLVVGQFYTRNIGYGIARQYIVKGLFKNMLFLDIQNVQGGFVFCAPTDNFFAALYPKLPDGGLEIKREDSF